MRIPLDYYRHDRTQGKFELHIQRYCSKTRHIRSDTMQYKDNDDKKKDNSALAQYKNLLVRYPLLVNGLQAAVIAGLSVLVSQIIAGVPVFDWIEVRVMMLINFAYHTPILLQWGGFLSRSNMSFPTKLIIDQALFSPFFTAGIIGWRLYLLGTDMNEIPGLLIATVPGAMMSSWLFWVPAKAVILMFVPAMYQFLANSGFAFVWNIIFAAILRTK